MGSLELASSVELDLTGGEAWVGAGYPDTQEAVVVAEVAIIYSVLWTTLTVVVVKCTVELRGSMLNCRLRYRHGRCRCRWFERNRLTNSADMSYLE